MANLANTVIKYALFFFNLLIFILSIVVISLGGVLLSSLRSNNIDETLGTTPRASCILLIVVGSIALIISFLGCCGARKESYQLLYAYGTILFVVLVVEVVTAVIIFGFRDDIKNEAITGMKREMENYHDENGTLNIVDELQVTFHCCGAENYTDWNSIPPYNSTVPSYPPTCCGNPLNMTESACVSPQTLPCWKAIENELKGSAKTLGNTAIVAAVLQLFSIVVACILARTYRREYDIV